MPSLLDSHLRMVQTNTFSDLEDVESYQCSGTPVDCVKLAVDKILHRKPDICLSGVNHGANHSINVIYSGTMSAALEAAIESIPSIGFSLLDYSIEADFEGSIKYARMIVDQVLHKTYDKHLCLNVNIRQFLLILSKALKFAGRLMPNMKRTLMKDQTHTGKNITGLPANS
jgi:5'-nucleotidase